MPCLAAGLFLALGPSLPARAQAPVAVILEAEDLELTSPMVAEPDPSADGGRFISVPNGAGSGGLATVEIEVPRAADYVIFARTLAPTGSDDSFFVRFDEGPEALWDLEGSTVWRWTRVRHRGGDNPISFPLTAGTHRLTIRQREDGARLDRLIVTDTRDLDPFVASSEEISPLWSGTFIVPDLLVHEGTIVVSFYDEARRMTIGVRDRDTGAWILQALPSSVGWDSHNAIALGIDKEGYLHVSGNMHNVPLVYFRSTCPYDPRTLVRETSMVGPDEDTVTYPRFYRTGEGILYFQYRDGGSGDGVTLLNVYDVTSRRWSRALDVPLFDGLGSASAYPVEPVVRDGMFHLIWVWRVARDASQNQHVCYARSTDFLHWETSAGEPIELPFRPGQGEIVDPVPVNGGLLNGSTHIGFDGEGRVLVSYHKYDANGNTNLFTARRESNGWQIYQTTRWPYRWTVQGGGTLARLIRLGPVTVNRAGDLVQLYQHWIEGAGTLLLDPVDLSPLGSFPSEVIIPSSQGVPDDPDLSVFFRFARNDLWQVTKRWAVRWESLPSNGDRPPSQVPAPSILRLIELRGRGGDLEAGEPDRPGGCGDSGPEPGALYMTFQRSTILPGLGRVEDEDIVAFDLATGEARMIFDGSDVGLASQRIKAFTVLDEGIVLTFGRRTLIQGLQGGPRGARVDAGDLVLFVPEEMGNDTRGTFSFLFDGSDLGLRGRREVIDALAFDDEGNIVFSVYGVGSTPDVRRFAGEDLLLFRPLSLGADTRGSLEMLLDGSLEGLSGSAENIDGVSFDARGNLVLSTLGNFSVGGISGRDHDLFLCRPSSGRFQGGSFEMFLAGESLGLATSADIAGIQLGR